MKCEIVHNYLSAYLDGEVPVKLRQEVAAHLATCAACRAELAALEKLENALGSLSAPMPADITPRVISRVKHPALPWWRSLSLAASLVLGLTLGGALAGSFYPLATAAAPGNGNEVLAMEEVFRDFPQGSYGGIITYQDEEENSA
jgi:anti-sigma factor RsiW